MLRNPCVLWASVYIIQFLIFPAFSHLQSRLHVLVWLSVLGMVAGQMLSPRDLLSPALSPAELLRPLSQNGPVYNSTVPTSAGDLARALSTMDFHRYQRIQGVCNTSWIYIEPNICYFYQTLTKLNIRVMTFCKTTYFTNLSLFGSVKTHFNKLPVCGPVQNILTSLTSQFLNL